MKLRVTPCDGLQMMEMTRVKVIEHIKRNVQLEREVSDLKQQVRVGVSKLFLSFPSFLISTWLTIIVALRDLQ